MLDKKVCANYQHLDGNENEKEDNGWETEVMLGMESHLGDFASEGLRTLVLGVRILTEEECAQWMAQYKAASVSISNRDELLVEAAFAIETELHIVGATAIEDKLQDGVAQTIANLAQAGIRLWVLTGDKRETAIEIGYSTRVLEPSMDVKQVVAGEKDEVIASLAMEFMQLVKSGKLAEYQNKASNKQRKIVREYAETIVRRRAEATQFTNLPKDLKVSSPHMEKQMDLSHLSKCVDIYMGDIELKFMQSPSVFDRASSAQDRLNSSDVSAVQLQKLSVASKMSTFMTGEDDTQSLASFVSQIRKVPDKYDKAKRTILERCFAVDKEVRHGRLVKHLRDNIPINESKDVEQRGTLEKDSRALVIEGAALSRFLGDPVLEEMLFAVGNACDSVIACRVSPRQKALLVRLVRTFASPSPVTLAIGDGANDVGMIQEAHVGVGISGLEGKQAVNASDFAIAQFKFLQELVLIHGRYDFIRLSNLVLYSFYKNAVFAMLMVLFSTRNMYSGTPVFHEWVNASFNVVATWPIVFYAWFDRDLEKDYVMKHPMVYSSTRNNEYMKRRSILRWFVVTAIHVLVLFYALVPLFTGGASYSSFIYGLIDNEDCPGDGEGGDLLSVGTVLFTCMLITLGYKVLYESKTIVHGEFPWNNQSKLPWTWFGVLVLSLGLWAFGAYCISLIGITTGSPTFSDYIMTPTHTMKRPFTWICVLFIPLAATVLDVALKAFANIYFPSQTQIHIEIGKRERAQLRKAI